MLATIAKLIIKSITVKGFTSYGKETTFSFGDAKTLITGDNYQGKSSIINAIEWGLCGTVNGSGRQEDRLVTKGEKEMFVSIELEHNGSSPLNITRQTFKGKSTTTKIYLGGNEVDQKYVDAHLLGGNKDQFLSMILPDYFCTLAPKDARELLMSMIPVPDASAVLAKLTPSQQEVLKGAKLHDPDFYAKTQKDTLDADKEQLTKLTGAVEYIRDNMIGEEDIPEHIPVDTSALDEAKRERDQILMSKPPLHDTADLQLKQAALRNEYRNLQSNLNFEEKTFTCEKCNHVHNLAAEQERINEETTQKMLEVETEGKNVAARINVLTVENEKIITTFNEDNAQKLNDLQARIQQLENNRVSVEYHNTESDRKKRERSKQLADLKKYEGDIVDLQISIELAEARIAAAKAFRAERCEMQLKTVKDQLEHVTIEVWDIVKSTGEMKDVFKLYYDGKEYKSLSTSEKIRCGLEVSALLRSLSGSSVPVIIDNGESITHYKQPEVQVFETRVIEGAALSVTAVA